MGMLISILPSQLFPKKKVKILMVGLDAAGKTTILYKLNMGEVVTSVPIVGHNVKTIEDKNMSFTVFDINGQPKFRQLYGYYFTGTDAIIYVVDSTDSERIEESRQELVDMLSNDLLRDFVLLVLANKQDLPHALSSSDVITKLGLQSMHNRNWYVQATCATTGIGHI